MSNNEICNMYFGIIEDKRSQPDIRHPLVDVLKLVMIAIICGIDELEQIIDYGKRKIEFLKKEFEIALITFWTEDLFRLRKNKRRAHIFICNVLTSCLSLIETNPPSKMLLNKKA